MNFVRRQGRRENGEDGYAAANPQKSLDFFIAGAVMRAGCLFAFAFRLLASDVDRTILCAENLPAALPGAQRDIWAAALFRRRGNRRQRADLDSRAAFSCIPACKKKWRRKAPERIGSRSARA